MDFDTFLGILREQGLRASTSLPDELRDHTACAQMHVHSGFIEAKPLAALVLVHGVDLAQQGDEAHVGPVVKYSPSKYALASTEHFQIGTAQHYRDFVGGATGVRDEQEAVYVESLRSYFGKWNPEARARLQPWRSTTSVGSQPVTVEIVPSGTVTYRVDGQWIFCCSIGPQSHAERTRMYREFEANCITHFHNPEELACEVGSAFAQMAPAPPVLLDEWFHQVQDSMLRTQSSLDRIVHVRHGPVVYTDDAEAMIESVPLHLRPAAVPFVKSTEYTYQREYRFTVSTIGAPATDVLLVPVTAELRALGTQQEE